MRHALIYVGAFEPNYPALTNSTSEFKGSDGNMHPYPAWPSAADGLHICYMERAGKNFVVVRIADGTADIVLEHDMVLIPGSTSASACA